MAERRMSERDPAMARTRVKICGLTNLADARAALDAGADLLGFIFYAGSPRCVSPEAVRDIIVSLASADTAPDPRFVGVFVNTPVPRVVETMETCGLHLAQLHGEEGTEVLDALARRAYKALRPTSADVAEAEAARYAALGPVEGPDLLVDAHHPALRGGTGKTADWTVAAQLARHHRLLLAGGLRPDNVATAVRQVAPWGVDVSSGVEARPAHKDHAAMRAFIAATRQVVRPGPK